MKAVICPVCRGEGKVCVGICPLTLQPILKTCHGCNGKGWVAVPEAEEK